MSEPGLIAVYRCSACEQERYEGRCACSPDEPPLVVVDYVPAAWLGDARRERDENLEKYRLLLEVVGRLYASREESAVDLRRLVRGAFDESRWIVTGDVHADQ